MRWRPGLPRWMVCEKIPYATKIDALLAMNKSDLRAAAGQTDHPLRSVYRCRCCSRWHTTSRR